MRRSIFLQFNLASFRDKFVNPLWNLHDCSARCDDVCLAERDMFLWRQQTHTKVDVLEVEIVLSKCDVFGQTVCNKVCFLNCTDWIFVFHFNSGPVRLPHQHAEGCCCSVAVQVWGHSEFLGWGQMKFLTIRSPGYSTCWAGLTSNSIESNSREHSPPPPPPVGKRLRLRSTWNIFSLSPCVLRVTRSPKGVLLKQSWTNYSRVWPQSRQIELDLVLSSGSCWARLYMRGKKLLRKYPRVWTRDLLKPWEGVKVPNGGNQSDCFFQNIACWGWFSWEPIRELLLWLIGLWSCLLQLLQLLKKKMSRNQLLEENSAKVSCPWQKEILICMYAWNFLVEMAFSGFLTASKILNFEYMAIFSSKKAQKILSKNLDIVVIRTSRSFLLQPLFHMMWVMHVQHPIISNTISQRLHFSCPPRRIRTKVEICQEIKKSKLLLWFWKNEIWSIHKQTSPS